MMLMQDECRGLSLWLATRVDSRRIVVLKHREFLKETS
jgi:hypothetical protein